MSAPPSLDAPALPRSLRHALRPQQLGRAGLGVGAAWMRRAPRPPSQRSLVRMFGGLVAVGVGVGAILASGLGANAWDVLAVGLADHLALPLTVVFWSISVVNLSAAMALGQRPGPATLVPALICGPVIQLTLEVLPTTTAIAGRLGLFTAGFVLLAAGAGVYLTSGCRPGPTDMLFHGLGSRGLQPWQARLLVEGGALLAGVLLGGPAGIGTLVLTIGLAFAIPAVTTALPPVRVRRAIAQPAHAVLDA